VKFLGKQRPNFQRYQPSAIADVEYLPMNLSLTLKVETNIKLNLINNDKKAMIEEEYLSSPEIHFLLMETVTDKYDMGLKAFK